MNFSKILGLVAINCLILLSLLIVTELILRALNIGYGNAPTNPDPVYHHVHPANYKFNTYSSTDEFGEHEIFYDQQGNNVKCFEQTVDPAHPTIVFLGDSFVEAVQVPFDSSFVGRLSQQFPNTNIINEGVASYSPAIHYLVAKNKVIKAKPLPNIAVLMLYSNDVGDDESYLRSAKYDKAGDLIAINGGEPNFVNDFFRQFYLVRLVRKSQMLLKHRIDSHKNKEKEPKMAIGGYIEESPDWVGTNCAKYTLKTIQLLESQGIETFLTVVPSKYYIENMDFGKEELSKKVQAWSCENNIQFIDLIEPFQKLKSQQNAKLFFDQDIHFNETGHNVAANVIAEYLRNPLNKGRVISVSK